MTEQRMQSFTEFWPYYMHEHSKPATRSIHVVGTTLAVLVLTYAVVTRHWVLIAMVPVIGYGFAWVSHFSIEKNRPATFTYPLWSLMGDFKLWFLTLTFQIGPELVRLGLAEGHRAPAEPG
ncbi:MAG: DUF962 domain-containing protein [Myxococcota bacterium]